MMPMNTNTMTISPMPMWNLMTSYVERCMSIGTHHPNTCGYTCPIQCTNTNRDTTKIHKSYSGSDDGQNSPPISPPPNSKGKVVPQEPSNGGWFVFNT